MGISEDGSKLWRWLTGIWSAIATIWRVIVSKTSDRPAEPKDKLKTESQLYDFSSHRGQSHQQPSPRTIVTVPEPIRSGLRNRFCRHHSFPPTARSFSPPRTKWRPIRLTIQLRQSRTLLRKSRSRRTRGIRHPGPGHVSGGSSCTGGLGWQSFNYWTRTIWKPRYGTCR